MSILLEILFAIFIIIFTAFTMLWDIVTYILFYVPKLIMERKKQNSVNETNSHKRHTNA